MEHFELKLYHSPISDGTEDVVGELYLKEMKVVCVYINVPRPSLVEIGTLKNLCSKLDNRPEFTRHIMKQLLPKVLAYGVSEGLYGKNAIVSLVASGSLRKARPFSELIKYYESLGFEVKHPKQLDADMKMEAIEMISRVYRIIGGSASPE